MNGLLIVVGIIFLVCMIIGFTRGFVKIVASLAATIAIIVLVTVLSPYVSGAILKFTPIEEFAQDKCMEILMLEETEGEEEVAEPEYSREEQIALIENAELPEVFQQLLLENNNSEIYETLGVTTFGQYVGSYLAKLTANIVSFLLTLLVVTIVIRTILYILGIISDLPVIGGLNRLAGGALGLATGLVVVWILFIIITLLYDTEIGVMCLADIAENNFLTILYENNILMDYVLKFRG